MKKSIRRQYTLMFAAVITVILFSIWCANNLFLENFYIKNKEKILRNSYVQIDEMMKASPEHRIVAEEGAGDWEQPDAPETEEEAFLRELGEKYNVSIFIQDTTTGGVLSTEPRGGRFSMRRLAAGENDSQFAKAGQEEPSEQEEPLEPSGQDAEPRHRPFSTVMTEDVEILEETERYTIRKVYDRRAKSYYLQSIGELSDPQAVFVMSAPLAAIQESVALSNRFLTFISLAALVLGSIVVFIATQRQAKPIMELSRLSEQMRDLNFEAKYEGNAENEIGVLGSSMNALADKLKETMGKLKSANMKLQSDIEQKIRIDEMRKDFISNVSHELKTPITIIHGYAEGLADGMCKDEDSRNFYYQVILNESDKMTVLVKQLLNLSDLEFGFDPPKIERFDLTELIGDVLASSEVLFKEKKAEVEFTHPEPVYVWADEFKIEEVLHNYLSNALNHLDGARRIRIGIERQENVAKVFVFNTGKNIPEQDIPMLWNKFYKVDKARTREYGGSGIGLSIVKAIMDSHHRECGVENRRDGVAFWFTLDTENRPEDGGTYLG